MRSIGIGFKGGSKLSYNSRFEESKNKVYSYAIATKILDLMDKLRLDENENSSRRWVWELMQNAKDVAHDDIGVSIEINFQENGKEGSLEFKHNGKPFSIDNLTFLIEQVSTKERKPEENVKLKTTGKFGTGFLTTHLLSEVVEVESIVKEPEEPYRKFNLRLDRSGRNIKDIIASVDKSLASLENIDSQPAFDQYSPTEITTVFRYKLDESGIEVAKKGLRDLSTSLSFTLAFLPEIKSVTMINDGKRYELCQTIEKVGECIKIYTVTLDTQNGKAETKIAILSKNDTCIAVQIEDRNGYICLKEFDSLTPRLFCDFPLVGTEDFPFPVIINSPLFNPNEPRNGIYLTDKLDPKIKENKKIIGDAIELYYTLLKYASAKKWANIYLLAKVPSIKEKEWISKKWFESSVVDPIKKKLLKIPIVDTENHGRISILNEDNSPNVCFPSSPKEDLRNRIWDLANLWIPSRLPRKADVNVWYKIIWKDCCELSLEVIARSIQDRKCLEKLEKELVKATDPVGWLNSYYELIKLDKVFLDVVINDKYAVIPNQNGIFKKRSELKFDKEIEEELKNVLSILNVEVRDYLLHKGVYTDQIKYDTKDQCDIVNEINKILQEGKNKKIGEACNYLVTLFSADENFPNEREEIFEFCKVVYPETVNAKREIRKWSANIWSEVDKKELQWITGLISQTKNVEALTEKIKFSVIIETLSWLNRFICFLTQHDFDNLLNHKKEPILPNQNGYFRAKDDLFLDDGEIDETLKDISAELGYDFRDELLDINIYLDLPQNRTKNQTHVAEEITRLITLKFAEFPRTDETKQIFKKLYLWFNKNKEKAEKCFGELYNSKHRLYDDDEIAENIQKAEELSELMEEFGVSDLPCLRQILLANRTHSFDEIAENIQKAEELSELMEESGVNSVSDLREILLENRNYNSIDRRQQITQETLVSLGVTSKRELEDALKDKNIADKFIHTSTPSVEMFQYVQGLISRAKANVIEYLKTLPDYDCSEMEELATTVIGGIKKYGLMIHVVVRPSDNGEVIMYYSSEKDTLDYENAELWIDNDRERPSHLTLGKILKITGISKILLY